VAKVLATLDRPGVVFRERTTQKFRCLLPGHEDRKPSATLGLGKSDGRWSYRCHACDTNLTMAELYATVRSGRLVTFDGQRPTVARWLLRMWHEAGIDTVMVPDLAIDATIPLTPADRRYAEGFLLLRALRHHHGDPDLVPFTHGFAAAWCAMSEKSARRAARKLLDCGWLRVKEAPPGMRCGHLFDTGQAIAQNEANPLATVVPWVVLGEGGLPVEDEGAAGLPERVLPAVPSGVEVEAGGASVDEGDGLPDVAQVVLAEAVAFIGRLDASGGPTGDVGSVVGHAEEGYAHFRLPFDPNVCPFS